MLGLLDLQVELHPEVVVSVTINVARSEDEAKLQEKRDQDTAKENAKAAASDNANSTDEQPEYNTPATEDAA